MAGNGQATGFFATNDNFTLGHNFGDVLEADLCDFVVQAVHLSELLEFVGNGEGEDYLAGLDAFVLKLVHE